VPPPPTTPPPEGGPGTPPEGGLGTPQDGRRPPPPPPPTASLAPPIPGPPPELQAPADTEVERDFRWRGFADPESDNAQYWHQEATDRWFYEASGTNQLAPNDASRLNAWLVFNTLDGMRAWRHPPSGEHFSESTGRPVPFEALPHWLRPATQGHRPRRTAEETPDTESHNGSEFFFIGDIGAATTAPADAAASTTASEVSAGPALAAGAEDGIWV